MSEVSHVEGCICLATIQGHTHTHTDLIFLSLKHPETHTHTHTHTHSRKRRAKSVLCGAGFLTFSQHRFSCHFSLTKCVNSRTTKHTHTHTHTHTLGRLFLFSLALPGPTTESSPPQLVLIHGLDAQSESVSSHQVSNPLLCQTGRV